LRKLVRSDRATIGDMELDINAKDTQPVYLEALNAIKQQMDAMKTHCPRLLVFRLDVRLNRYTPDNKPISKFIHKLSKWITKTYGGPVGYIWAREQDKAPAQHYHLLVVVNGKAVRHPSHIITKAEAIAEGWEWPKPYTPRRCYYDIRPNDEQAYRDAFYRASYLAKSQTKTGKGKTANYFGASRVKPKPSKPTVTPAVKPASV